MLKLDLRVPPLVVWSLFAAAISAAAHGFPSMNLPFAGHRVAAVIAVLGGSVVAVAAIVAFRRAKTTVNPLAPEKASSVVTSGIYRLTRNPMYCAMAAALLGIVLWWVSMPGLVLVGAYCAYITRFQILPEEQALLALFGDDFSNYMSRVRRWI